MRWLERAFDGVTSALGDWLASLELLKGRVRIPPLLSLLLTLFLTAIPSFATDVRALVLSMVISTTWGFFLLGRGWLRFVKASILWGLASLFIMAPRILLLQNFQPLIIPLRVSASVLAMEACTSLFGARSILAGFGVLARDLPESIEAMISQVSYYLRNLGRLLLGKGSRYLGGGHLMKYSLISLATSELLGEGRERAFRLSLARRSRSWSYLSGRWEGLPLTLAFAVTMSLPLLGCLS